MRMLKITTVYPLYLKRFYGGRPQLESRPYAEQKQAFDYDAFGMADFWSHALRPLGYDVWEVSANAQDMQWAWAREHGVAVDPARWFFDIPFQQALQFKPDLLFMDDYHNFSYDWIQELKAACPSIRFVVSWCGAPYSNPGIFKAHDLVLSCVPELVEEFTRMGHRSAHLHHGFEPRILDRIQVDREPRWDFTFVGQIARGKRMHGERERMLRQLAKDCDITIFSPAGDVTPGDEARAVLMQSLYHGIQGMKRLGAPAPLLSKLPFVGRAASWEELPPRPGIPELKRHLRHSVFGLEMFQTLHDSRATFNSHIDVSPRSASNMRLWEATGVGACLVTDWKENLHELLEPDREVVTYRSTEECVEKVRWLLDHPRERAAIAAAGQARTLREHTIRHRVERFDAILQGLKVTGVL